MDNDEEQGKIEMFMSIKRKVPKRLPKIDETEKIFNNDSDQY